MEARQIAQKFITECGFRKVSFNQETTMRVDVKDFNSTSLALFLKKYAYNILIQYTNDNGGMFDVKKWWDENYVKL